MRSISTFAVHPFDPISPLEIQSAVSLLTKSFPNVKLRFKLIDINEPVKKDVIPYIEAERLGKPLPAPPARIVQALYHSKTVSEEALEKLSLTESRT